MTSISFRSVLVACAAFAMLGFAIPNVQGRSPEARATAVGAVTQGPAAPATTEAEPLQQASCGDGRCSAPEDCNTCPRDCGSCCGDRRCMPPEDCRSCPGDCGGC